MVLDHLMVVNRYYRSRLEVEDLQTLESSQDMYTFKPFAHKV